MFSSLSIIQRAKRQDERSQFDEPRFKYISHLNFIYFYMSTKCSPFYLQIDQQAVRPDEHAARHLPGAAPDAH